MTNKLISLLIVLSSLSLCSCEDVDLVGTPASISVDVFDCGLPLSNAKVYMFESNHGPSSSFFKPFFADTIAITDSYGKALFNPEIFRDIETFYFAIFDGDNCLGYISVNATGGDSRSAELFVGGMPVIKEVLRETTLSVHSINYKGDANNRSYVPVKLPPNTVSFVYSVSSNFVDNTSPTLDLLSELMRRYDPTNGLLADIIRSLDAPTGTADCSLYLIKDNVSLDKFNDKNGNFQYYPGGSRKNYMGGIVEVDLDEPLTDTALWYLGVENPDDEDDIFVTIEVCALVLEE